jgi:hypothetical protein
VNRVIAYKKSPFLSADCKDYNIKDASLEVGGFRAYSGLGRKSYLNATI